MRQPAPDVVDWGRVEPAPVLLIGEPRLRECCRPIEDPAEPGLSRELARLVATLEHFRARHGFGRAISAPQIGLPRRLIAMNLGQGPFVLINPVIVERSDERFTLWDDCMSFPWLMVKVERHREVEVEYLDPGGEHHRWAGINQSISELLQHEIDHLDGILAVDRAVDRHSIVARDVYLARREHFDARVDATIIPTVQPQARRSQRAFSQMT